ncbi:MAG: HvfC/BufC family peptide modification chaperone [Deltaproteobacteria bacterium]
MPKKRPPASLLDVERWFFALLQRPAIRVGRGARERIVGDPTLSAEQRLHIYASMYLERLLEALEGDFPRCREALGGRGFRRLSAEYLRDEPSRHPSLRHAGDRFPAWLASRPKPLGPPWLPALARFERAIVDAFDSADVTPLSRSALERLPPRRWAALRFGLHPSARLLRLANWPVGLLGEDGPARPPGPQRAEARVWRLGHEVLHASMDTREARALRAVASGATFARVCEIYDDAALAAQALATWLEEGLLVEPSSRSARHGRRRVPDRGHGGARRAGL